MARNRDPQSDEETPLPTRPETHAKPKLVFSGRAEDRRELLRRGAGGLAAILLINDLSFGAEPTAPPKAEVDPSRSPAAGREVLPEETLACACTCNCHCKCTCSCVNVCNCQCSCACQCDCNSCTCTCDCNVNCDCACECGCACLACECECTCSQPEVHETRTSSTSGSVNSAVNNSVTLDVSAKNWDAPSKKSHSAQQNPHDTARDDIKTSPADFTSNNNFSVPATDIKDRAVVSQSQAPQTNPQVKEVNLGNTRGSEQSSVQSQADLAVKAPNFQPGAVDILVV